MVKVSLKQRGLRPFNIYEIRTRFGLFEAFRKNTDEYAEKLQEIGVEDYIREYGPISIDDEGLSLYNDFKGRPVRLVGYQNSEPLGEEDLRRIEKNLEELADKYL